MQLTDLAGLALEADASGIGALWQALLRPLSGAAAHHVPGWMAWHGRAMALAWGVMLPLGVLVARYYKVTAGQRWPAVLDNKRWWRAHLALQYGGVLLMTLGLAIVLSGTAGRAPWRNLHSLFGWSIVLLAWLQLAGGNLRGSKGGPQPDGTVLRGDHYDMTPRRLRFEWVHKCLGYGLLLLSSLTIFLGLALADAPLWMWLALAGWTLLYVLAWMWLQRRGRCLDTYQAIWGPDPVHPGNHVPPVGWGIRRRGHGSESLEKPTAGD